MKKLWLMLLATIFVSGCSTLMPLSQSGAKKLADIKEAYCHETSETTRMIFRQQYNTEMDLRGLPHDEINCP